MTVASKLVQVMKKSGYMSKDKQLSGGAGYRYLSEEQVTAQLHDAFEEAGLVIMPCGMEIIENREDTTRSGSTLHNTRIRAIFRLVDAEDGDTQELVTLGEGSDSGDKCLNKCMTSAYKYALRQAVMISTGDDPDHTPSVESVKAPAKSGDLQERVHQKMEEAKGNGHTEDDVYGACDDCGEPIRSNTTKAGKFYSAKSIFDFAVKDHGRPLCNKCGWAAKKAKEAAQ